MLCDLHTGNPLSITSLTPAFIAVAEPYSVTLRQARAMLGGQEVQAHSAAQITEAARTHADTDVARRGPASRVFVRVGNEFHAVGVGTHGGSARSHEPDPMQRIRDVAEYTSTRAVIGLEDTYGAGGTKGNVETTLLDRGGAPNNDAGVILAKHYTTMNAAGKLVGLGRISELAPTLRATKAYDDRHYQLKDRAQVLALARQEGARYAYVFVPKESGVLRHTGLGLFLGGGWVWADANDGIWRPLKLVPLPHGHDLDRKANGARGAVRPPTTLTLPANFFPEPASVGALLEQAGFRPVKFNDDAFNLLTLRAGFLAYTTAPGVGPATRVDVEYYVKGERSRPTPAELAKKVEKVAEMAAALHALAPRISQDGTKLTVWTSARKREAERLKASKRKAATPRLPSSAPASGVRTGQVYDQRAFAGGSPAARHEAVEAYLKLIQRQVRGPYRVLEGDTSIVVDMSPWPAHKEFSPEVFKTLRALGVRIDD